MEGIGGRSIGYELIARRTNEVGTVGGTLISINTRCAALPTVMLELILEVVLSMIIINRNSKHGAI
jgi:hypothetical protein